MQRSSLGIEDTSYEKVHNHLTANAFFYFVQGPQVLRTDSAVSDAVLMSPRRLLVASGAMKGLS
jgi:hypothetical protein